MLSREERQKLLAENPPEVGSIHWGNAYFDWGWKGCGFGQLDFRVNRETGEILYGRVPPGAVVVPGSLPARDGSHSLYCAVIIKQVDEKTRGKVGINELLRDI
jgi:hypothetical protein